MADTLFQNYFDKSDETNSLSVFSDIWLSQVFTPAVTHNITKIALRIRRYSANTLTLTASIQALDVGNDPDGTDLCVGTFFLGDLSNQIKTDIFVNFTSFPELTAGTSYAIVLKVLSGNGGNKAYWYYDTTGTYTGGDKQRTSDAGASWTTNGGDDHMFEEYGTPVIAHTEIVGTSDATSTVSGAILWANGNFGSSEVDAVSTVVGVLSITGQVTVAGSSDGTSTAEGALKVRRQTTVSIDAVSTTFGILIDTGKKNIRSTVTATSVISAKIVTQLKANGGTVRMIPFIFSDSIAYMMESGHEYFRFFFDGKPLLVDPDDDDSDHVEVNDSPYQEDELYELQTFQIADTMWIVHPDHEQTKLTRTSATEFSLDEIEFKKGPFLLRNDLDESKDEITLTPDAIDAGDTGTLTASAALFESGHVGALFQLIHPGVNRQTNGSLGENIAGVIGEPIKTFGDFTFRITTTGWSGKVILQKSVGDSFDSPANVKTYTSGKRTFEDTELVENTFYRILVDEHTTGTITASLVVHTNSADGKLSSPNIGIIEVPIDVKGDFNFNTHGTWRGTVVLERNENEAGWESFRSYTSDKDRNIQFSDNEEEANVQYRINVTNLDSGSISADLTSTESTVSGIVRITGITSSTVAEMEVVSKISSAIATKRWAEGAWSDHNGFPNSVTFHDGRCVYAGTVNNTTQVWLSEVDDYENFEAGINDADSFSLILTTTNRIEWMNSLSVLVIGTRGDEWVISPTNEGKPLTPTDFNIRRHTTYGSTNKQSVLINEVILFADAVGRKAREFTFQFESNKFVAPDLTALAEHITESGIVNMAYQRSPDSILWCVLDNGNLISMTYEREQNVIAWARHPIDGIVHSVAVIPGDGEDEVWFAIQREIQGNLTIYIEQMSPRGFDTQSDAFFVDSGVTDSASKTTTITGLDHLEDETVRVLADGKDVGTFTVSSGEVELNNSATVKHAGLAFASKLTPMRMDVNTNQGTSHGSIKVTPEVVLSFFETAGTKYGFDEDNLHTVDLSKTIPPDLFTGDSVMTFVGGFGIDDEFLLFHDAPLPCVLRGIVQRTEITGR